MKKIAVLLLCAALAACAPAKNTSEIKVISVPDMPALGPYSQAVEANGFVFLSGIVAYDSKAGAFVAADIDTQTHQVFSNAKQVLAAADLTLDDVVKVTIFLKNPKDFPRVNELYAEYFPKYKPARSTVPGADWGRDDVMIEIEMIARRP